MKKDFIPSPVKVLFPLNGSSCWLLHRNTPTIPQDYFFARTHDEAHAKKQKQSRLIGSGKWWWEMDSNHRSQRQQIYSLPPLAARESHRMERVKGIEPSQSAWKADVLPLNYTRKWYGAEYTALFANVKPYSSFFFTFSEFSPHDRKLDSQKTKVRHSHRRKKSPPKGGADAQNPLGQSMTPAKTE